MGQFAGSVVAAPAFVDPNAFRPAKQYQWSLGLQRELNRNLVVEASYVANRGSWWPVTGNSPVTGTANVLQQLNTLSFSDLARYGFTNLTSLAESNLLTTNRSSLTPAQLSTLQSRGINLAYSNFPSSQNTRQMLAPFPQYLAAGQTGGGIAPAGAPLGNTWYDSLQINITQRFSHGLSLSGNYTYSKNLDLMNAADIFNRQNGKTYSTNDIPQSIRMTAEYQVPNLKNSSIKGLNNKVVAYALGNWGIGWFVAYQSASALIRPNSNGAVPISNFLGRGPGAAQLKLDPATGKYMNPYSVNWTDYDGKLPHRSDRHQLPLLRSDQDDRAQSERPGTNVPDGQLAAQQDVIRSYRGIRARRKT